MAIGRKGVIPGDRGLTPESVAAGAERPLSEHRSLLDDEILRLERERPSEREMIESGEVVDLVTGAQLFALTELVCNLKARREVKGIGVKQLAEMSGLTRAAISRLENGRNLNPTLETLFRYSLALDSVVTLGLEDAEG